MTADVDIGNDEDRSYYLKHDESPLSTKYCACADEDEDVRLLVQDCMCHHCNRFCLRDNKKNVPRTCQVGFGDEDHWNSQDTLGMQLHEESMIYTDKKGINQFRMKSTFNEGRSTQQNTVERLASKLRHPALALFLKSKPSGHW